MAGFYGGTVVPTDYSQPTSFVDSMSKHFDALYRNFPNRPKRMSALEAAQTAQIMQNMRMQRDAEGGKSGDSGTAGGMMKGGGGREKSTGATGSTDVGYKEDPRDVRAWNEKQAAMNREHDFAKIKAEADAKRTGVYNTPGGSALPVPSATQPTSGLTSVSPGVTQPAYSDNAPYYGTNTPYLPESSGVGNISASDQFARSPESTEAVNAMMAPSVPSAIPGAAATVQSNVPGQMTSEPVNYEPNPAYTAADLGGVPSPIANAAATPDVQATQPDTAVPLDSYAKGSSYVPKKGLYELEEGEAVIPTENNPNADAFAPGITGPGGIWDTAKRGASAVGNFLADIPLSPSGVTARDTANMVSKIPGALNSLAPDGSGQPRDAFSNYGLSATAPLMQTQSGAGAGALPAVKQVAAIPPAQIAQNSKSVNAAQVAEKPQMDYATWAKQNPTMAGKGDALLDPAKRDAFIQSMKSTGAAQSVPGGGALPGPIIKDYAPSEQAAAQSDWSNIQRDTRPGGGGMAVHDATGEQIVRTDVLPAAQKNAGPSSEKELRAALGQRVLEGWQKGELNLDDTTKALKGLQDYDNSVIKGGLPGVEEKLNMRYEKDKQKAEEAYVRKQESERLSAHRDEYKEYTKEYNKTLHMEDPQEAARTQMQLNQGWYEKILPQGAKHLAGVPEQFENSLAILKRENYEKRKKAPNDQALIEENANYGKPEYIEGLKKKHAALIKQRNDAIAQGQRR